MRELPFSVWKARRNVVSSARSSAPAPARRAPPSRSAITSRASSRKISRISSSSAKSSTTIVGSARGATAASGSSATGSETVATKSTSASDSSPRACATPSGPAASTERLLRLLHRRGQRRLVGGLRLVREALEVARDVLERHVVAHRAECQQLRLFDQARLDRRGERRRTGRQLGVPVAAAHHRAQRAGLGVVAEQRLGHLRLHAEHVDQEAERAEVAGEAVEQPPAAASVRLGGEALDLVAHAAAAPPRPGPCRAPTARRASTTAAAAPGSARVASAGLRKNWSICCSTSDSEARSSCTTLPIVWRSETRRYSSSIQPSSGSRAWPGAPWPGVRRGAGRGRRVPAGRSRRLRARPRRTAGWSRLPSPAAAAARRPIAASAAPPAAARRRRSRRAGTGASANRRPARTAPTVRPAGASRRRRPPTRLPSRRRRACAPARSAPGRSGRARCCVVGRRLVGQAIGLAHRGQPRRLRPSPGDALCAQKNSRSCASRSETSASPRSSTRNCASSRDATRLLNTSSGSRPLRPAPRRPPTASFHKRADRADRPRRRRGRRRSRSCARPRPAAGRRASARAASASSASRTAASGDAASACASAGSSRQRQSAAHRSAGCTRSAPAASCTARYCGNSDSGETVLPASRRAR